MKTRRKAMPYMPSNSGDWYCKNKKLVLKLQFIMN
jgi:hypothetical protein